ncbi:MAG TPA: zinc ribbon domain-containing protein, partial [Gemmatimonadales bacterium]|nr:zinc ribbon domain-containing protein [Gemmatimonadales bacterium]
LACGSEVSGSFCSNCGAAQVGGECTTCGAPLRAKAQFCSACGKAAGSRRGQQRAERTPWLIAGVALAALLAVVLIMVASKSRAPQIETAAQPTAQGGEAPPDISNMSPRERFNALYNRIMQAAQSGDEATVSRFMPMALGAYTQLDTLDADARYHAALLKVHTGLADESRALADTILAEDPGHLFGYVVLGTVARFRKDKKELNRAYSGFLKQYDGEMKRKRPEYSEHETSLDDFHKAALAAGARPGRS